MGVSWKHLTAGRLWMPEEEQDAQPARQQSIALGCLFDSVLQMMTELIWIATEVGLHT